MRRQHRRCVVDVIHQRQHVVPGRVALAGAVLAALVAPDPALDTLHRKVRSLLHGAGLMLPRERYRPHVTLARFNGPADDAALAAFATRHGLFGTAEFEVGEIILYRSTLGPKHAIHTALAEYPLI